MDKEVTEANPPDDRVARRRLLGVGLGGAAAALLPFIAGRAGATTPVGTGGTSTTGPGPASTTTTVAPKRPTAGDVALLGFAQSAELATRDLYDVMLAGALVSEAHRPVLFELRENHEAYAQSISGMLGRQAPNVRDEGVFTAGQAAFGGPVAEALGAAYQLENALVATHEGLLGKLEGLDGVGLVASVVVVEARHGTVLADMVGGATLATWLVDEPADPLEPAEG